MLRTSSNQLLKQSEKVQRVGYSTNGEKEILIYNGEAGPNEMFMLFTCMEKMGQWPFNHLRYDTLFLKRYSFTQFTTSERDCSCTMIAFQIQTFISTRMH